MTKNIRWTKKVLDTFFEESNLNERVTMGDEKALLLIKILKARVAGWTIVKQSQEFNISVDTVNKYIKELKLLYDATQKTSHILPKRKG